ncbi:MAG: ABC transporter ATP-binding protein [Candidatus Thorarchaeota archaeon]
MDNTITKIKTSASKIWDTMKTWRTKEHLEGFNLGQVEPGEVIVEMTGMTKRFPGVIANDAIDFQLRAGEIHALLGENGAGKTTLARILYGLYTPDAGEIKIRGTPVELKSPRNSIEIGIGMVHQHFTLIPAMTVAENIILGLKSEREPLLNLAYAEEQIIELSRSYGLEVDPKERVNQLPMGVRQRVEIVKALFRGARVLILDEPTSVLTPLEVEDLFQTLRSMVKEGMTVVMITHKLPEVMAISDRVTVLRRGKVVATIDTKQTNPVDLSMKMVGRAVDFDIEKEDAKRGRVVLEVNGLSALDDEEQLALKDISFSIHQGEILGIAGVSGNGQSELAEVLTGMRRCTEGTVHFLDKDVTNYNPGELIEIGIGDIPEDRPGMGLIMNFSIAENLILETHTNPPFSESRFLPSKMKYFLNDEEIRKYAEQLVDDYDIAASSVFIPARNLSGGNLQKLLLAKVLSRNPKLLIAAQPTAGLDVGATEFISNKLLEQRSLGVAILLISENLDRVMSLSDRIVVMYEGRIVGSVSAADADINEIGRMMTGIE